MDVYTLDQDYTRTSIIDDFSTMIWSERYSTYGDFELEIYSSEANRSRLPVGTMLSIPDSNRIMRVQDIEDKLDADGKAMLKFSGFSLEKDFLDRTNRRVFSASSAGSNPSYVGTPEYVTYQLVNDTCIANGTRPIDNMPNLQMGFVPGTTSGMMPGVSTSMTKNFKLDNVYNSIKEMCDAYSMGFRITRNFDPGAASVGQDGLWFGLWTGRNRTTDQNDFTPVIFSPELDNIASMSDFTGTSTFKNVAYVYAVNGAAEVYPIGWDATNAIGPDRHVLIVDASDITTVAGATLNSQLQQRGLEELSKYKGVMAFDGDISVGDQYLYGSSYDLGDLVEVRNGKGAANIMRVTEQIFISDSQGDRSYPTLTLDTYITPGSWFSWDWRIPWEDAPGTWADA